MEELLSMIETRLAASAVDTEDFLRAVFQGSLGSSFQCGN
jgi:hypothetical protein